MSKFSPFSGHVPCPKCGGRVSTWYHPYKYSGQDSLEDCRFTLGWPVDVMGRPLELSVREEEHLHRRCEGCKYEWLEAILDTSPSQEEDRVVQALGLKNINQYSRKGYRVVAAWSFGGGPTALMEKS